MNRTGRPKSAKARPRTAATKGGWTESYLRAQITEKELNLSNKSLTEIPPAVFRIEEVEILDVSDNPLGSIPAGIATLSNLKEMRVAGCPITEISGSVQECKYLSKIDFSRNPLIATVTLPATLKRLRYLEYVALRSCSLKSLPNNLTHLETVQTIDLSKNALSTLPDDMFGLKQLKVLILTDNAFESIPDSIMSLGRLECLEMKRNKLNNRRGDLWLSVPPKLKILDVEDNCSLVLLPDGFEQLKYVEELNISYCGIETLPDSLGRVSSLKTIHLAGNKLRTLPDSFGRLRNLETLDLEGNRRLTSLPPSLHRLRELRDRQIGKNTGLVLSNTPALQVPDHKIVREGVVSVRTDLLAEECYNQVTVTIATEVIDDTIIDNLSDDIVTIVEGGLPADLMIYMIDVAIEEEECAFDSILLELVREISNETVDEENAILNTIARPVMEELMEEIVMATAKSIALEEEEEWRLGQTVPEEYDKPFSYEISTVKSAVQSLDLPAGCKLSIPPGATDEDTSVISMVLNPHGYDGTLQLEDNQLLVSDIIEMRPSGMTFYEPVQLKIPHSFPKFDCEREYIVMTSEDNGRTWVALKTLSDQEQGQRFVTVEVTHFSSFAVVARPLEHCHRVTKGEASTLTSSEQTGIKLILLEDSIPEEKDISFNVTPVDGDTLARAGLDDPQIMGGIDGMSHIVNFVKGSNLLLNRPATIMLPLSPGAEDGQVRVLSCNDRGQWEDITSQVEDVVLQETKVAFKTDRLSSGFVVLRCGDGSDATGVVNLVTKNVRARHVRTVIFKKWIEPRELGKMTARMECVLEESVQDRICRTINEEKYELQEGTPTPPVSMVENETFCALFHGNIHPDVEMVNDMYGVNFTFYCERTRRLEFDVKVEDMGRDAFSLVELYPGPREMIRPFRPGEIARPAEPLTFAEISVPTGPNCDYWLACQRFKNTLGIEDTYFSPDHDKCFCETCHRDRGEPDFYLRGNPEKKYAVPVGWARFGLSINPSFRDADLNVFTNWHRAYHGTKQDVVTRILQGSSMLLMPGDVPLGGGMLRVRPGHITPDVSPRGFDTVQVFVSPSIVYSGLDAYASPQSYEIGPETVGARRRGETIDPLFSNHELEWSTRERGGHVTPVDSAAMNRAGLTDAGRMSGMDSMSHIVRIVKGSNLLLNRPATIWLPLSPGKEDSKVRVLSCNKKGNWEDVTDKVDDVVLKESKVAFKTFTLSSGYTVICCDDSSDASGMVNLVANSVRARHVRTVIFKKWMEPRERGIMKARMEAVLEESVDDRITCAKVDKYELQEGTPTPSVSMLENETFCALFNGNLLPDVTMVNNQYGQNFKFYCDRTNRLEFNLKLVGKSRVVRSRVHIFPGPKELYHPCERGETAATPLATAEITAPTGNICDYWLACRRFKKTLEIEDSYFNPDEDRCFCEKCHKDREENDTYFRGRPKKRYALPVGWCRFGLSLQPTFRDQELNVFGTWHRAYHGTKQDVVKLILKNSSMLLMPGDVAMGGHQLGERPGHFNADKKPEGFDTAQVFVSPSIVYAGLDQYATAKRFRDEHDGKMYKARVAFQLCIRPGSYKVGPETVGARKRGETIDPLFSNNELEWSTVERGGHALYGLLVKLEEQ
ncbi:PREDICTED: uncharacterized protein LOC109467275 [Branchiostoma belcheri]|uniref:Uncharacterized protein LOC109467275 n=1 Tax=Branchiostoma belcheri TaxID=7741 RepID=A0A6P4Y8J1_BRABE|nr:PREDICTED: uncharacterized protein LOC109467275 [Branchiostoma belcheri]